MLIASLFLSPLLGLKDLHWRTGFKHLSTPHIDSLWKSWSKTVRSKVYMKNSVYIQYTVRLWVHNSASIFYPYTFRTRKLKNQPVPLPYPEPKIWKSARIPSFWFPSSPVIRQVSVCSDSVPAVRRLLLPNNSTSPLYPYLKKKTPVKAIKPKTIRAFETHKTKKQPEPAIVHSFFVAANASYFSCPGVLLPYNNANEKADELEMVKLTRFEHKSIITWPYAQFSIVLTHYLKQIGWIPRDISSRQ